MAEQVPVSEVRRVVIEYEIRVPSAGAARPAPRPQPPEPDIQDLARKVRDEFIRTSRRNPDMGF